MKKYIIFIIAILVLVNNIMASNIKVELTKPYGILKMGDVPVFKGKVINVGNKDLKNIIVYLSLASLKKGTEHPVDLEDWSARKAMHINRLSVNNTNHQNWKIRLIQSGNYGVFLTVINPRDKKPIVSDIVHFKIMPKKTVSSARIIPVAIGMPGILILFLILILFKKLKFNWKN